MGRAASKMENIEELVQELEEAALRPAVHLRSYLGKSSSGPQKPWGPSANPGVVVGTLSKEVEHVAKSLEAHRLQFAGEPSFDPVPYLDNQNRRQYLFPLTQARQMDSDDQRLPRVKVRCRGPERMRFLEKLDEGRRLELLPLRLVEEDFANGAFAIPKDAEKDRLVLDARRPNAREDSERRWIYTMGAAGQLQHLYLREGRVLVLHAEDLKDYYHAFVVSGERIRRNIFQLRFRPRDLKHLKCYKAALDDEDWVVPSLATMAMGDTNAVAFGQVAHLSLILRNTDLGLEDFIGLKLRPSRKDLRAGLMIDDFVLLEEMEKKDFEEVKLAGEKTAGGKVVERVRRAYEEAGLPRHPKKAVEQELGGEFWGMTLDGNLGVVRPNLKRVVPLAAILLRVVQAGKSSVGLLEVLSGSLVSVFQARRRCMSSLHEIYAAQRGRERNEVVLLSGALRQELLVCIALMVVAVIDLRLEPGEFVVASDASSRAEAAVRSEVGKERMRELQRHGLQKGLWSRLLSPAQAFLKERGLLEEMDELPECTYEMHPLWETISKGLQFEEFGKIKKVRNRRHINVGELAAALAAEKLQGEREEDSFYVHLQDSQVSLACLVKGRSASPALNKLLRRSIPFHVAFNNRAHYGFLRSKFNPADDPTRSAAVRLPVTQMPDWWADLEEGRFDRFDSFLKAGRVHPLQVAELPDPQELLPDAEMDWRTARERKAERGRSRRRKGGDEERAAEGKGVEAAVRERDQRKRAEKGVEKSIGLSKVSAGGEVGATEAERAEDEGSRVERGVKEEIKRKSRGKESRRGAEGAEDAETAEDAGEDESAEEEQRPAETKTVWSWQKTLVNAFRPDQFVLAPGFKTIEEAIQHGSGLLDMFSGARGFAKALTKLGCPWAICFDLKHHPSEDLLQAKVQRTLRRLLLSGAFVAMAAGPVCASFSTAITPPWRTLLHPGGRPDLTELQQAKVNLGHAQLSFTLALTAVALSLGVLIWIENPDSSWFWKQPGALSWSKLLEEYGPKLGDFRIDQCAFGTPWRKRTKFRTNCHLAHQRVLCRCQKKHVVLRGCCKVRKQNFTKIAESYPSALCSTLATAFAIDLGWLGNRRKLDINNCARHTGARIGEAKNPGPRRPKHWEPRRRPLDDFQLLEPQTIKLRARIWDQFMGWLDGEFGVNTLQTFLQTPPVFVKVLEAYGRAQYDAGSPLHYFRQLLAHVQKEFVLCKPFMSSAWSVVTQWELAEPLQHRTPLPEPVMRAMVSLCLLWGWKRFAASLLLAFFGIARIGEVLVCKRQDLLTPTDLLTDVKKVYMQVKKPKSRNKGASTQYITCDDELATRFIEDILGPLQPHETLFPLTVGTFRRRWDKLLSAMDIPAIHRLTPGGIRGGGAVMAHTQGTGIVDLMWKMRLAHSRTLGHYLQETTAASVLPSLSDGARCKVTILRDAMPFLVEIALSAQPS